VFGTTIVGSVEMAKLGIFGAMLHSIEMILSLSKGFFSEIDNFTQLQPEQLSRRIFWLAILHWLS